MCEWQDDYDLSISLIVSYSLSAIVDLEFVNARGPGLSAEFISSLSIIIAGSSPNVPLPYFSAFPCAFSLTEDSAAELDCSCGPVGSPWSKPAIIRLALSKWVTTTVFCSDYYGNLPWPFSVGWRLRRRFDSIYIFVDGRWTLDNFFSSFGSAGGSWCASRVCSLAVAYLMSLATFTAGASTGATFGCAVVSARWLPDGLLVLPLLPRARSFCNAGLISELGSRISCSSAWYGCSPICTTEPNFRNLIYS